MGLMILPLISENRPCLSSEVDKTNRAPNHIKLTALKYFQVAFIFFFLPGRYSMKSGSFSAGSRDTDPPIQLSL